MWLAFTRFGQLIYLPPILKKSNLHLLNGVFIPEKPVSDVRLLCPPPKVENFSSENRKLIQKLIDDDDEEDEDEPDSSQFRFPTVADYRRAYRAERCTPVEVAKVILETINESNRISPPLRAIVDFNEGAIQKMAQESADRWREGKTLSLLDGIPVSVKGEFRTEPYSFRCGSLFQPIFADMTPEAHLVKNLKEAGAIVIGVASMHEFGTGSLGSNPNRFNMTARNPYNTECYAGGSSSGSAVSVAAGLCPISLGADGGGSVRIPAALCGLVGLKPTYSLLESSGEMPIAPSLSCSGPLCASVLDTIIAMDVLSKNLDGKTVMPLKGVRVKSLSGLRIGVYRDFFNHCDEEVLKVCKPTLQVFESLGASIVDIKIPELEESRIAHLITIFSEFANGLACEVDTHFDILNNETLLTLAVGYQFTSVDYLNAQKQRTRAVTYLQRLFKDVDVIVTPSTACAAPKIDKDAIPLGKSMAVVSGKLVRFATLANLAGNPAISYPIGVTSAGLPVGLQLMGKWYEEKTLLQVSLAMERSKRFPPVKPRIFYDVLGNAANK